MTVMRFHHNLLPCHSIKSYLPFFIFSVYFLNKKNNKKKSPPSPGSYDCKIIDFGLAKTYDPSDPTSGISDVNGTPAYMAPEICWRQGSPRRMGKVT